MAATLGLVVAEVFAAFSAAVWPFSTTRFTIFPTSPRSAFPISRCAGPNGLPIAKRTYGYHRAGTLAAFTNAFVLVLLSLWLGYEAFERFRSPVAVSRAG